MQIYHNIILLKTKNDLRIYENITYSTYRETVIVMGLIEHETQIYNIFEEACQIMLPIQLRKFFASFHLCENIEGFIIWPNPSQIRWPR